MKRKLFTSIVLGLALSASASAYAYDGYVTGNVNLRAGPDSSYPTVAQLRSGTEVAIEGCVDDWTWCDVADGDDRGWVSGDFLQEEYDGRRVRIHEYGVRIGIPVVSFVFGSYWDDHYRSRSWYHDRDRYSRVTPHYHGAVSGVSRDSSHESRQSGTTSPQTTYQNKSSTTAAPQHSSGTQMQTQETTATSSRPVEHKAVDNPASDQHRSSQQQSNLQSQSKVTEHKAMAPANNTPPREMPTQSKSPPVQDKGRDQNGGGKNQGQTQGGAKDQGKDQGGGKDQGKDKGGDKDHKKDQGGGKDPR